MRVLVELRQERLDSDVKKLLPLSLGWYCKTTSPFSFGGPVNVSQENEETLTNGLAVDDFGIDAGWINGFETSVYEELVNRGVVSAVSEIAVFEVVIHGRRGPLLFARPGRFFVMRTRSPLVLYACNSIEDAFAIARILSNPVASLTIDTSMGRRLHGGPLRRFKP